MADILARMQIRRGPAAQWATANPILRDGELGFETDTKILRVGDGITPYTSLRQFPSVAPGAGAPNIVTSPAFTGQARRFLRVNEAETAAEFAAISGIGADTAQTITNLNALTIGGEYFAASGATGSPNTEAIVVKHYPADTTASAVQEAFGLTSGRRWFRRESGGTWQAWAEIGASQAGAIVYFAMSTAPAGFLKANGALVSRTVYASLFAAIGTTHGAGDGVTTFRLPDLRGEFIRVWDDGRGVDSGRAFASAQTDQNQSHSHTGTTSTDGAHTHSMQNWPANSGGGVDFATNNGSGTAGSVSTDSAGAHSHTFTTSASGGAEARPRNVALLACIAF